MKSKFYLVVLFSIVLLSGCSSSGAMKVTQPLIEPITADKTVSLTITNSTKADEAEDCQNMSKLLKEYLFTKLVTSGVFKSTVLPPGKSDYNLEVNISGVRIISPTARILVGVMAGASAMEADVKLKDIEKNRIITTFNVEGSSASHPLSSETGYENAVRELADHIIKGLRN